MLRPLFMSTALLASSLSTQAAEQNSEQLQAQNSTPSSDQTNQQRPMLAPYFGLGLAIGGDNLLTIEFEDGSDQELTAGRGLFFEGGLDVAVQQDVFVRGAIGYHFASVDAENGSASFDRYTFEGSAYKTFNRHGIGVGISHHRGVELSCDFDGICDGTVELENATGPHIEYNYRSQMRNGNGLTWSIRYTSINYEFSNTGEEVDGSHIDFNIGVIIF